MKMEWTEEQVKQVYGLWLASRVGKIRIDWTGSTCCGWKLVVDNKPWMVSGQDMSSLLLTLEDLEATTAEMPSCADCGAEMMPNGQTFRCLNCGSFAGSS